MLVWAIDQLVLEERLICCKKSGYLWVKQVCIWSFEGSFKLWFSNDLLSIVVVCDLPNEILEQVIKDTHNVLA